MKCLSIVALLFMLLSCTKAPEPIKEARGVWISRYDFCDVEPAYDQGSIKAYIQRTIQNAAAANFNMIFFQIRGAGDAYYSSNIEPWGKLLTGRFGENPGWDPLEFAINEAHKYGLELHAWMNTFPVWRGKRLPPETSPQAPILKHSNWLVCDKNGKAMPLSSGYTSFSPNIPQVQDYLITLAKDIANRYDVDGMHFDYIRFPENARKYGYSHDPVSIQLYESDTQNPQKLSWEDWQREQLNTFVSNLYNTLTTLRPELKISMAVLGSYNGGGWTAYHSVYQDARRWAELGKTDFLTPMIYWPLAHNSQPFLERAREWQMEHTFDRYTFPGMGSYRYTTEKKDYNWQEIQKEIKALRYSKIKGMVFFSARSLEKHWNSLSRAEFKYPANIPPMPWKIDNTLTAPEALNYTIRNDSITIYWNQADSNQAVKRYNIYYSKNENINTNSAETLLFVTPTAHTSWSFKRIQKDMNYIAISALDAVWNESPLSESIHINIEKERY